MENNVENKEINDKLMELITNTDKKKNEPEIIIHEKDGLFEHSDFLNKRLITSDGRQLLKEVKYEN